MEKFEGIDNEFNSLSFDVKDIKQRLETFEKIAHQSDSLFKGIGH